VEGQSKGLDGDEGEDGKKRDAGGAGAGADSEAGATVRQ
jgi:hypothetical protein